MTETTFKELVGRRYRRISSHQIDLISVNTKYHNERTRRGTYYFQLPLVYTDEAEESRRIVAEVMFNPAFTPDFIHHNLNTAPDQVDAYIDQLLQERKADRNQKLLRILDESAIKTDFLLKVKARIAHTVRHLKYWDYQNRKAHHRDPDMGSFYLRPIREE